MNFVPAQVEAIHVIINNSVFSPAETTAKAGDMVTSINKDIVAHTATVHGGFDVAIETNTSASLVLTKAGIVEYYCRFHPNMKGRITITPLNGVREYFTKAALRFGATCHELLEAIWIAAEMGASGAYAHAAVSLAALDETESRYST